MDEIIKQARRTESEGFLTLLSGLRRVPANTKEDIAYNSALADAFDYIVESKKDVLYPHTVRCGKWVRDEMREVGQRT